MRFFIIILLSLTIVQQSCIRSEHKPNDDTALLSKIDSLREELKELKNLQQKDSTATDTIVKLIQPIIPSKVVSKKVDTITKVKPISTISKQEKIIEVKHIIQKFYYKNSKRISVIITPWLDGKRTVTLFDTLGNETYRFNDVRLSYSITTEIKSFHDNGAVYKINNHINPGASMYWYDTEIDFDSNNEPISKMELRQPASLDDYMNGKSTWNKKLNHGKKTIEFNKYFPILAL